MADAWQQDLYDEQQAAAAHVGCHARLLAGPGTGKTLVLTRRIVQLVDSAGVDPRDILAITFTRHARRELADRVEAAFGDRVVARPTITTLHSFALRQLLRNSDKIDTFPSPLRIANEWEKRHIIDEDLKESLSVGLGDVRRLFNWLATDWSTTQEDTSRPAAMRPDPTFIGHWQQHRTIYGYTLLDELVYRLKRALEQVPDIDLDREWKHVLVDEYQDLNQCDIAVASELGKRGAELFVAGDDDQSIYSFRHAYPEGIRRFPQDHEQCTQYGLMTCVRCGQSILDLAEWLAQSDPQRVPRPALQAVGGRMDEVALLRFPNGNAEAIGIARLCANLVDRHDVRPEEILVLLRADKNGTVYSAPIRRALTQVGMALAESQDPTALFDGPGAQVVWALLRLCVDRSDSLAFRVLLELRKNGIGRRTFDLVFKVAVGEGIRFGQALQKVANAEQSYPRGSRVTAEMCAVNAAVDGCLSVEGQPHGDDQGEMHLDVAALVDRLAAFADGMEGAEDVGAWIIAEASKAPPSTIKALVELIEARLVDLGPAEVAQGVTVMTMHKAKGLTADAVFVAAAEDEVLPIRESTPAEIGDDRRLLYVSLTRARRFLFVTYSVERQGAQRYTGRSPGKRRRMLTRFLRDGPIAPEDGRSYVTARIARRR